jgi:prepilin-type N-terminal cleavage/methylation domain-containing protein
MSRKNERGRTHGFTLIEVLISITILSLGTLGLAALLARSSREARLVSMGVYRTAALSEEVSRLGAVPFTSLAAGTTCVTITAAPFPHTRCSVITTVSAKVMSVKVRITPTATSLAADSTTFERSTSIIPPLNTP